MHPFIYVAPTTLNEASAVLEQHGERARPFAGGTDLLVQLRGGRFELDAVVDLKGVPAATELSLNGGLRIGAAVPCCEIYENGAVAAAFPGLIDAASLIGGTQIQSRASFGGNLCNASPSADGICPLIVHSAVGVVFSPQGERRVPVEEFCTGPGATLLGRGELLAALEIPAPPRGFGAAYQRFIPRNEMDIAVVGVASALSLDESGEGIASARIALAAVGPRPLFATKASASLAGRRAAPEAFAEAGEIASSEAAPIADMRGTAEHRIELVKVLTRRTLAVALERAREHL